MIWRSQARCRQAWPGLPIFFRASLAQFLFMPIHCEIDYIYVISIRLPLVIGVADSWPTSPILRIDLEGYACIK